MKNNSKKKLAIFDFCDTIFNGQSVSFFLNYLEGRLPLHKKVYSKIIKKINITSSTDGKRYKEILMRPFLEFSYEQLNNYSMQFYNEIIKKRLHKDVVDRLLNHKNNNCTVVIVSGGFDIYLKYFQEEYNIDFLVSTKLDFQDNIFLGKIAGNECLGDEKVRVLKQTINLDEYDLVNSFCYSDSSSDTPLFNLVGNKIIVKNHQDTSWADDSFGVMKV
ncbi:HAD-IB family hydrolase [Campylobacter mucosalis]|uniref:HAD-IB family hydrolase n=1 Tax=Campylobacter mucosalis TaxID=202 RepID=UPI00146FD30C|nr:HAD-IB family hydrolase [Campylobacter mucosalis]